MLTKIRYQATATGIRMLEAMGSPQSLNMLNLLFQVASIAIRLSENSKMSGHFVWNLLGNFVAAPIYNVKNYDRP